MPRGSKALSLHSSSDVQSDQPGDHHRQKERPEDPFEDGQRTRDAGHRRDVPVPYRRQAHQTEVEKRVAELLSTRVIGDPRERSRLQELEDLEQIGERDGRQEIVHNGAEDHIGRDFALPEQLFAHDCDRRRDPYHCDHRRSELEPAVS
jgi:hypothetical protein